MSTFPKKDYPVKWIPVGDISVVYTAAQRGLSERKVEKIIDEFDPNFFGVLTVMKPNGKDHYHIIDGQHRAEAVRRMWGDSERAPCIVIPADSIADAANAWTGLNAERVAPQAIDRFRVAVTAERDDEVEVNDIIHDEGYRLGLSGDDGMFSAVSAAMSIYRAHGPDHLRDTFQTLKRTWGMARDAVNNNLLRGFSDFLAAYGPDVDRERLADKVSKEYTPARLLGAAKAAREMFRGTIASNVARVLVQSYNHGLRTTSRLGDDG